MSNTPRQPRPDDAVLGGQSLAPIDGAVLGGIEGLRQRYTNGDDQNKIIALKQAINYNREGIELIISALNDTSITVQLVACQSLQLIDNFSPEDILKASNSPKEDLISKYHERAKGKIKGKKEYRQEALKDYSRIIEIDPNNRKSYLERANLYCQLLSGVRGYKNAIEDYSYLIKVDSNDLKAYGRRAYCYEQLKDYQSAIQDYSKILRIDHNQIKIYSKRARIYKHIKQYEKAIEDYSFIINNTQAKSKDHEKAVLLHQELLEYTKAINDHESIFELNQKDSNAFWAKMKICEKFKDYNIIIFYCSQIIQTASNESDVIKAYEQRGHSYESINNNSNAIEDFSHLIKVCKNNFSYYLKRIKLYEENQDYENAINDLKYVINQNLDEAEQTMLEMTCGYEFEEKTELSEYKLQKFTLLLEFYNKKIDINSEDIESLIARAKILIKLGERDEAKRDCDFIIEFSTNLLKENVDNPDAYIWRGKALSLNGESRQGYQEILKGLNQKTEIMMNEYREKIAKEKAKKQQEIQTAKQENSQELVSINHGEIIIKKSDDITPIEKEKRVENKKNNSYIKNILSKINFFNK